MAAITPVRMVRACAPNLAQGHLLSTVIAGAFGERSHMSGRNRCPQHDDPAQRGPSGACLDSFWSQRYLASLTLLEAARLWWSWRKAARR
jgi:hypothetical protein